jgi:hypothetical protein
LSDNQKQKEDWHTRHRLYPKLHVAAA